MTPDTAASVPQGLAPLREFQELRTFLPICAWCKQVRHDDGAWGNGNPDVEPPQITHSVCPECAQKLQSENGH